MARDTIQKRIYNSIVLPVVYGVFSAVAPFHSKLRETFRARRNIRRRWQSIAERLAQRPVWFHVSSVGEFEQAKPVISTLAEKYPDVPVALTFTSPSGYEYARKKETTGPGSNIQFMDYLPVDFASNARFCLASLNPRLLVFVKFDLWPNLIWEANAVGVPIMLIDATLSERSYRLSALGRRFYHAVYRDLENILAISELDAARFNRCVPDHTGIAVAGDTRFDRVMERKRLRNGPPLDLDKQGRFVIVAGSTWPKDEAHLLPALARLARDADDLLLVVAPHEPTAERVGELLRWAETNRIDAARLSDLGRTASIDRVGAVVVDSVGVLAEIYESGDAAYVGGSFSTGVHSVIEPAIMGIPVLFGPVHENSFEAIKLLEQGAAATVRDGEAIYREIATMMKDEERRRSMGERARSYVESQLGATTRCMQTIEQYL